MRGAKLTSGSSVAVVTLLVSASCSGAEGPANITGANASGSGAATAGGSAGSGTRGAGASNGAATGGAGGSTGTDTDASTSMGATSAGAGGATSGGGTGCASTGCGSGQVCHPYLNQCVAPGAFCTTQADCSGGTYCDAVSGTCLAGTTGSECATNANCENGTCVDSTCGCSGLMQEQELIGGALDIYFIFDRTASMGQDCSYQYGAAPPVSSKACFATYAISDYLINVNQAVDTRLAFQFMSLANDDCNGGPYSTPLVDLTPLPLSANDPLIQAISNENFAGGFGTHIEGALRGIAAYTSSHVTQGREMIGVLMTDGDPNGCEENIQTLRGIIADHLAATGLRTFVIGMQGATDSNLEQLASAGGADPHNDWCGSASPPCHYWNVGNGSGDAIASALQAIINQAAPLPCEYDVVNLQPPPGETLDYGKVNVTLTDPNGVATIIGQVPDTGSCPADQPAWFYDNPTAPATLNLCPNACSLVTNAANGSHVSVVVGCEDTVVLLR